MTPHVVDASAVLAFLAAETGWEGVAPLLNGGVICAVNFGEVLCRVADQGSDPRATAIDIVEFGLRVVDFTNALAAYLPDLRAADRSGQQAQAAAGVPARRRKRLSLADMCCLALALHRDAPVVTGDSYWASLGLSLKIIDYRRP